MAQRPLEIRPARTAPTSRVVAGGDDRPRSPFQPIRPRKVADEVVFAIVNAIRGGMFEPGDRLPRERDLAEQMEVSRTTIREALRILERAEIISVRRGNNGGMFVRSRSISPAVLELIEGQAWANLQALLHARRLLETACAVMAGAHASPEELEELERLAGLLDELLDDPAEFVAVDLQWHLKVGQASQNPVLADFVDQVLRKFAMLVRHLPVAHIDLREGIANQQDTLAAIRSGDRTRIEASVDRHLGSVEEHLLGRRLAPVDRGAS